MPLRLYAIRHSLGHRSLLVYAAGRCGVHDSTDATRQRPSQYEPGLRLSADYWIDPRGTPLAPLSGEIIDAAREDDEALQREPGEPEIVDVFL